MNTNDTEVTPRLVLDGAGEGSQVAATGTADAARLSTLLLPPPPLPPTQQHRQSGTPSGVSEDDAPYPMPFAVCTGVLRAAGAPQPPPPDRRPLPARVDVRLPLPLVERLAAQGASVLASLAWNSSRASGGSGAGGRLLAAVASVRLAGPAVLAAAAAAAAEATRAGLFPGSQHLSLPLELPHLPQLLAADPPRLLLLLFSRLPPPVATNSGAGDGNDSPAIIAAAGAEHSHGHSCLQTGERGSDRLIPEPAGSSEEDGLAVDGPAADESPEAAATAASNAGGAVSIVGEAIAGGGDAEMADRSDGDGGGDGADGGSSISAYAGGISAARNGGGDGSDDGVSNDGSSSGSNYMGAESGTSAAGDGSSAASDTSLVPPPGAASGDTLLATLPLLLLPSAHACAEVQGLLPLCLLAADRTTAAATTADAAASDAVVPGGWPSGSNTPTAAAAGRVFQEQVAPLLLALSDAMSGPQQQPLVAAFPAAEGDPSSSDAAASSTAHQSQMAAYASEVERLLVLLLSRDMTHTAQHLVAAAERAGVAFANRHLLATSRGPRSDASSAASLATQQAGDTHSSGRLIHLLPPLAVRGGNGASSFDSEAGASVETPRAAVQPPVTVGGEAWSGFLTPPAAPRPSRPPRLGRPGLWLDSGGGDYNVSPDSTTARRAPLRAAGGAPVGAGAAQAVLSFLAPPAGISPFAIPPLGILPVALDPISTAAVASTRVAAEEPPSSRAPPPQLQPAAQQPPLPAEPFVPAVMMSLRGLQALLFASLSGGFPSPSDEADYHIYKATALRPAAGLLLLIELLVPIALLAFRGTPVPALLCDNWRCFLLLAAATLGPLLLVPAAALAASPQRSRRLRGVGAWLAVRRSKVVLAGQAAETVLAVASLVTPGRGLHQLLAALGSYPAVFITYGQLVKTALLQLNPKTATACTLLRALEHAAAVHIALRGGSHTAVTAPSLQGCLLSSEWSAVALLVAMSVAGLAATVVGDVVLRARWLQQQRRQQQLTSVPPGSAAATSGSKKKGD